MSFAEWAYRLADGIPSVFLPAALLIVGVIYAVSLRAFPFLHPIKTARMLFHEQKREALHALSMALAGTLGVGNIAGVALAVAVGGAGAVFWMWVSAAVSLFLKYGEIVLAFLYRKGERGGAMYYMRDGLGGRIGKLFSRAFAVLCLLAAFTLGSMTQANAAAESAALVFRAPPIFTALFLLLFTLPVVLGGAQGIKRLTSKLIPLLTVFYLGLALFAVCRNFSLLPSVFHRILADAFTPLAALGGGGAFLSLRAVRYGVTRGLLSNEAGAGTAPMAHATAKNSPVFQGLLGMAEVFVDTFVLCTATAFAVLLAFEFPDGTMGGVALVLSAFSRLVGEWTVIPLTFSVLLFVYATVLCWCFYGACALDYLSPKKNLRAVYTAFFALTLALGCFFADDFVWKLTDLSVCLMTLLNLTALLVLLPAVRKATRDAYKTGSVLAKEEKESKPFVGIKPF